MVLKNARILVIDDDVDILTAVRLLLKTEAAEVLTEKNPENIRSILYKNHFDLILLDVQMPEMNGFEVARTISDSGCRHRVLSSFRTLAVNAMRCGRCFL